MRLPPNLLFSKPDKPKVFSHSSQDVSQLFHQFCCRLLDTFKYLHFLLKLYSPELHTISKWGCTNAKYSRIITMLFKNHRSVQIPRMGFALLATWVHWWVIITLLSTSTTSCLSSGLLSSYSSSNLCLCLVSLYPRCRIQHFLLVKFMPLASAQYSDPYRSLCKVSCTLRDSKSTSHLSLIGKPADSAFDSCIQVIDKIIEQNWPQVGLTLSSAAGDQSPARCSHIQYNTLSSAFQIVFHSAHCEPAWLPARMMQKNAMSETALKASLNPRKTTSTTFSSSAGQVT